MWHIAHCFPIPMNCLRLTFSALICIARYCYQILTYHILRLKFYMIICKSKFHHFPAYHMWICQKQEATSTWIKSAIDFFANATKLSRVCIFCVYLSGNFNFRVAKVSSNLFWRYVSKVLNIYVGAMLIVLNPGSLSTCICFWIKLDAKHTLTIVYFLLTRPLLESQTFPAIPFLQPTFIVWLFFKRFSSTKYHINVRHKAGGSRHNICWSFKAFKAYKAFLGVNSLGEIGTHINVGLNYKLCQHSLLNLLKPPKAKFLIKYCASLACIISR